MVHFRGQFRETTAEPLSPWVSPPETVGRLFASRYRIIHKIGDGATGAVFRAEDIGARESVALKIFRPELSAQPAFVEALQARIRDNLERSGRAAGALAPFVDVIDIGKSPDGLVFAVMPYVSGEDFATLLRRSGPVPWAQARGLFVRMCETLDAYHRAGRIHGFLQSRRCLLIDGPAIRVLDTGVDRYLTGAGQGPLLDAIAPALARYGAPEQADGGALTPATDVYSLAVIFYELLTARLPFEDSSPNRMLAMHMLAEVPAPRAVAPTLGIPEAVEALLLRALAKRPAERFASMAALAEGLAAISTEGAATARVDAVQARPAAPIRRVKVHEIEGLLDPPDASARLREGAEAAPKVRVVEPAPRAEIPFVRTTPAEAQAQAQSETEPAVAPAAVNAQPRPAAAAIAEPTLVGLILPPLVNPEALAAKGGASSVAAAVAASLNSRPGFQAAAQAPATSTDAAASTSGARAIDPSASTSGAQVVDGSASASSSGRQQIDAAASASGRRRIDPSASSSGLRRRSLHPSSSTSGRRIIDLHPGASGSMRGRFDDDLHPSASGSMRMGAGASAGASGSRRIVNLVDVRAAGESTSQGRIFASEGASEAPENAEAAAAQVDTEAATAVAAAASTGVNLDASSSVVGHRPESMASTVLAPVSDDDTLSGTGIRPGPSRTAISWALGGIGALVAGSVAIALLSPPEAPPEAAAAATIEESVSLPVEPKREVVDEAPQPEPAAEVAPEAAAEEVEAPATKPKKKSRRKARSSTKTKKKRSTTKTKKKATKTKTAKAPEPEEDDVLAQVQKYMREKKEREAKQAAAVAEAQAGRSSAPSAADKTAARDRLAQARTAYNSGKFSAAYSLAAQSQSLSASADALELMALASCARGDANRARQVHRSIAAGRKAKIEARCRDAGITL